MHRKKLQRSIRILGIVVIIIVVCGLGYLLYQENKNPSLPPLPATDNAQTPEQTVGQSTFRSANKNISFNYPNILAVSEKNNIITLQHSIRYQGPDACDMRGDAPATSTLIDFQVTMQTYPLNIASTAETVSPYIPKENFQDGTLRISPGFIDTYNNGIWNGYKIYEGAEGCGHITYYIPISSSRTLVIQNMLIGALSDIADPTNKQKILAIPGAISKDQNDQIFNSIVNSLSAK